VVFQCVHLLAARPILDCVGFRDGTEIIVGGAEVYFPEYNLRGVFEERMVTPVQGAPAPFHRSIAINAGMGSGKTEAAATVSKMDCVKAVLIVTYCRALARQLAERFSAVCYLSVFDPLTQVRLVVVVNSLHRLALPHKYRLVIADEAGFIRRHFVSDTFSDENAPWNRSSLLSIFATKLKYARCVILLQDPLTFSDCAFYDGPRGFAAPLHRFYFQRPLVEDKYNLTTSFQLLLASIRDAVLAGRRIFVQRRKSWMLRSCILFLC
jgi:hypothetical protein